MVGPSCLKNMLSCRDAIRFWVGSIDNIYDVLEKLDAEIL